MTQRRAKLEVTGGFALLIAALAYFDRQNLVPMALLACLLHECGHWRAISHLGVRVRRIRLSVVGAEMELSAALSYHGELLAALAGPAVNLVLAVVFSRLEWGVFFAGVNLALGLFNLLPVSGLDGGRALACGISLLLGPQRAARIAAWLDRLCATLCLSLGVLLLWGGGNGTLLLVSLWLVRRAFHTRGDTGEG